MKSFGFRDDGRYWWCSIIISGAATLVRRKAAQEIISSSQLLTRACLAGYTAEGLLMDRPRAPRIRGWLGLLAWAFFILCVMSGPIALF
ncbi:MAG: hypothetical protein V4760_18905 [Bdellovibrionota bacterium]